MIDIRASGASTAGQAHILTCTATVVENLVVEPTLEWLDTDRHVVGDNDISVGSSVTTGTNTTLTLTFDPLHTSHGGRYTCRARINIPAISFSNSNEANSDVNVQSKSVNMCEAQTICCPNFKVCKVHGKLMVQACLHHNTLKTAYNVTCMVMRYT